MSEQPTAAAQTAAPPPSHRQRPPRRRRAFASTLFGYDIFISFALGFSGRGTQSYASDLARQLRERDFSVFYSEDEAAPGEDLDDTLLRALLRSSILVVIANRGTLEAPRWVRTEVETFRKHHPGRPIIPINIGGAMQDAALTEAVRPWLDVHDQIWLDDTEEAIARGVATAAVVDRLSLSPRQLRTAQWWRVTVAGVTLSLLGLAASTGWSAYLAHQNASRAEAEAQRARKDVLETCETLLDTTHDYPQAAQQVRALMFIERFRDDIDARLDQLGQ